MRLLAFCALSLVSLGHSQSSSDYRANFIVDQAADSLFPQIVAGDSWATRITLFNLDRVPARGTIVFATSAGDDMFLNFIGIPNARSTLAFEIPVNEQVTVETEGSGPSQQGFALLARMRPFGNDAKIGGIAVFRQRVVGRPDFESAVPLSPVTEKRFRLPFDNTEGFATGVAQVSWGVDSNGDVQMTPSPVEVEFWDENGVRLGISLITLPPLGHRAFSLAEFFPQLANRRGVVEFRSVKPLMGGLGLRPHEEVRIKHFHQNLFCLILGTWLALRCGFISPLKTMFNSGHY